MSLTLPRPSESTGDFILPDPGVYEAVFFDFEGPIASTKYEGSQSVILKFRITGDDDFEGVEIKKYYGYSMHKTRSKLYPVVKALLGRDIEDDEDLDLEELIDKRVNITLDIGEKPDRENPSEKFRFSILTSVSPIRRRPAKAAAATEPVRTRKKPQEDPFETEEDEVWAESA